MAAGTILAGISDRDHGSGSNRSFPIRKSANANSMVGHPLSFREPWHSPLPLLTLSGLAQLKADAHDINHAV